MRALLRGLGQVVVALSTLYGEYWALRAFFEFELCAGPDHCRWILSEWHPVAIGALFLFVYLPLSPIVSVFYAYPGYLLAAILYLIAGRRGAEGT